MDLHREIRNVIIKIFMTTEVHINFNYKLPLLLKAVNYFRKKALVDF